MTVKGADIVRDEVIGKGTSGEVYKVVLAMGATIAVKRYVLESGASVQRRAATAPICQCTFPEHTICDSCQRVAISPCIGAG